MQPFIEPALLQTLRETAKKTASYAYYPYSKYRVGATILTSEGKIYSGCNVENASYGLANCAERTAIFSAVAAGGLNRSTLLRAVVVYTPTQEVATPCGACRQVINEFSDGSTLIHSFCESSDTLSLILKELLPHSFGPHNLKEG